MTVDRSSRIDQSLCSVFSRLRGEDPGGTAPSWSRCLLVELVRPWASEIQQTDHFPKLVSDVLADAQTRGTPVKMHCIAPDDEYSVAGRTRVMLFSRPSGKFAEFDKEDYLVPSDMVGGVTDALVLNRGKLSEFDEFRQDTSAAREILVCTHAKYDRCCGKFGYATYDVLRNQYASNNGNNLRIWQTSHLGGHRFAPNLIDLPQGLNWVRIENDQLDALVYRNRPPSELKDNYRGRLALDTLFEQLTERELLVREGWGWTNLNLSGEVLNISEDERFAEVKIEYSGRDGAPEGAYQASVTQVASAPRVGCPDGKPDGEASQFVVSSLIKAAS